MPLDALIFDLDGTLVDSNSLHARAWQGAFATKNYRVGLDRLSWEIGKGGDHYVRDLLGFSADEEDGKALRALWQQNFQKLLENEGLKLLPGALEILKRARKSGLKLGLATSGTAQLLEKIEAASGIAWRQLFDAVTTSDDAKASKPNPDIVLACARKLGVSPATCLMFGDTIFDARACRHAGVVCFGIFSQAHGEKELREAGARRAFPSLTSVLENWNANLQVAAPCSLHLTQQTLEKLMRVALEAACEGMENGEAPIGCAIFDGTGQLVARGWNTMNESQNKVAHAEITTFAKAAGKIPLDANNFILVSTLEPCVMCTGAAMEAGVDTVIYGLEAPFDAGTGRVLAPRSPEALMPRIVGPILRDEARALFVEWTKKNEGAGQSPYIEQLLGST